MATIVTRAGKGSALTFAEGDANFTNLNTDKIELTNLSVSTSGDGSLSYNNTTGAFTYTGPGVTQYRSAISAGTGISYNSSTGVITSTVTPGIATVSADTTPSLGGNLNVAGNQIRSEGEDSIVIVAGGTGGINIATQIGANIVLTSNGTEVEKLLYREKVHSLGTTSGTVAPNAANGNVQTITLNGNLTLNAFTNPLAGQSITLIVNTGGTGRTLTSTMKWAGGEKTLSTTDTTDIISVFYDGTNYWASLSKDFQ